MFEQLQRVFAPRTDAHKGRGLAGGCFTAALALTIAPYVGAQATPLSRVWAGWEAERASIVARGTVVSADPIGAPVQSICVRIDRVLKGDAALAGSDVTLVPPGGTNPLDYVSRGDYALFFFGGMRNDQALPVGRRFPRVLIRQGRPPLAEEPTDVGAAMREEFVFTLKGGADKLRPEAARQLGHVPATKESIEVLRGLAASADLELKVAAVEALVWLGQPDGVRIAVALLRGPSLPSVPAGLLSAMGRIKDPSAVGPLVELLTAEKPWRRELAIEGLVSVGDGRAVPPLVGALDDKDADVRARAVCALARLLRRPLWGQAPDLVKQDEATYINRWKEWWAKEGKALFVPEEPKAK